MGEQNPEKGSVIDTGVWEEKTLFKDGEPENRNLRGVGPLNDKRDRVDLYLKEGNVSGQ